MRQFKEMKLFYEYFSISMVIETVLYLVPTGLKSILMFEKPLN